MRKEINSNKAPEAIGPYSQAIEIDNLVFISGQIPIDKKTSKMVEGIKNQAKQCFENANFICEEAGVKLEDAIKVSVLMDDMSNFNAINEVYKEYFKEPYPARVAYEVSGLPMGAKVEIDFIIKK